MNFKNCKFHKKQAFESQLQPSRCLEDHSFDKSWNFKRKVFCEASNCWIQQVKRVQFCTCLSRLIQIKYCQCVDFVPVCLSFQIKVANHWTDQNLFQTIFVSQNLVQIKFEKLLCGYSKKLKKKRLFTLKTKVMWYAPKDAKFSYFVCLIKLIQLFKIFQSVFHLVRFVTVIDK